MAARMAAFEVINRLSEQLVRLRFFVGLTEEQQHIVVEALRLAVLKTCKTREIA